MESILGLWAWCCVADTDETDVAGVGAGARIESCSEKESEWRVGGYARL